MVGPENPSELQDWLEKKKVDEGDLVKCLDRRPWTAKLPMIKDCIQQFHFFMVNLEKITSIKILDYVSRIRT